MDAHNWVFDGTIWRPMTAAAGGGVPFVDVEGRYNTPDIVVANGNLAELQITSAGFLRTAEQFSPGAEDNTNAILAVIQKPIAASTYTKSQSTNQGAANATNVKASAGNLYSVIAYNTNGAARFLFFVNTAGTPTGASASLLCPLVIPTGAQVVLGEDFFGSQGLNFSTGIGLAFMTTIAGGTLGTAGECFWTCTYK